MISVPQAAKQLGLATETLRNWHKEGKINLVTKSARRVYITEEDIQKIESERIPAGMKRCSICEQVDAEELFQPGHSKHTDCFRDQERSRYHNGKGEYNKKRREHYQENKEKIWNIEKRLQRYNLTEEEYKKLLDMKDGKCHICDQVLEKDCIDHDHITGKVRGILCPSCNMGIGLMKDDISVLQEAANYLRSYESNDEINNHFSAYYYGIRKGVLPI